MLHGRDAERAMVAALIDEAVAGRGGAMVLHGPPGVGKSALLADTVARAAGMRVLRTQGVESESPLAFAALHRLLRPLRRLVDRLPARQARALRAAFGEEDDPGTDRFVIFLAVLGLLAEAAEESPVLAVIDDAQWLDDASAAALTFAARRVGLETVGLLFAARDGDVRTFDRADLPSLELTGLTRAGALALLTECAEGLVAAEVAEQLLARTEGNPLALVELPGALRPAQLAGDEPLPDRLPVTDGVRRVFLDRAQRLPPHAQTLLLVVAADDTGDPAAVHSAAATLGAGPDAFDAAEASGLLHMDDGRLELRHPLVRSAVYTAASSRARADAHRALADTPDPDRRAWHLAAATNTPDELLAAALDDVAERARGRGGQEAAAAALERAAELTPPGDDRRAGRLLAAALAAWLAGQPARARAITDQADARSPTLRADIALLRARLEWNTGSLPLGHRIVLGAAADVAPHHPERARELCLFAAALAAFGGDSALSVDVQIPPPDNARARCFDDLTRGLTAARYGRWVEATDAVRAALTASDIYTEADQDLLPNLGIAALHLQDDDMVLRLHTLLLTRARDTGATILILYALVRRACSEIATGRWSDAATGTAEALALARATAQPGLAALPLAWTALLAALHGRDVQPHLAQAEQIAAQHPLGTLTGLVHDVLLWTRAHADPPNALHHLEGMTLPVAWHLAALDRVEAAVRADRPDLAAAWTDELATFAAGTGAAWALATVAHGRALLAADTADAERHFTDALTHHERSPRRVHAARTHLAFGEHLRRARRRVDARTHLRAALGVFDDLGATRWAERARTELRASGETARRRDSADTSALTPQELQVATLVAQGMPNRDAAAQLFVSPRTIEFHLRNIFTKLGITSRAELARTALAS